MLAASRADSKLNVQKLLSNLNYVINGFTVSGIGLKSATVNMSDGTLLIPQNNNDFSWFTTAPADPNVTIPDADLIDGTRNYVEISLLTENNTPVTRAFWDPEANGGAGLEFNQIVNTITDLKVQFVVLTGGFSGSVDRLPLCMIDTDGSGTIKQILDERKLFHRLGTPAVPENQFAWGTKTEPPYSLVLNGVSGTFIADEEISIGSETATILTGGTTNISFQLPSSKNFFPGDTVTGQTSGATGTINTVFESFTGVDKSIKNLKEDLDAIKTEILLLKNPDGFWWSTTESISDLRSSINAIIAVLNQPSYDESIEIVASSPGSNQLIGPVSSGTIITIPLNSRLGGSPQQNYTVGKGALEVFLNGQYLELGATNGWSEVGSPATDSFQIQIQQQLEAKDTLTFRLDATGGPGPGGGGGGGTSPGGSDGTIQYNSVGSFAGNSNFKIDSSDGSLNLNGLRQSILSAALSIANNTAAPASLFTFVASTYRFAIVEYSIVRNGSYRTGHFMVANDGTTVGYNDSFVNTASVGVTLTADISGPNVRILYTSTNTGFSASFKFSVRRWS